MGKGDLAPMDKANMSKERPILFSALMVKALLEGRKTQTRRIAPISELDIKDHGDGLVCWHVGFSKAIKGSFGSYSGGKFSADQARSIIASQYNPYGIPGDRLWVRETWQPDAPRDGTWPDVSFYGCKTAPLSLIPERYQNPENCLFRASWQGPDLIGWKPSIFMPRWASRITLEIVSVRVEKLQNISQEDAIAEGAPPSHPSIDRISREYGHTDFTRSWYAQLWEQINGAGSWEKNPFVWVVEFKIVGK
jgi:hypothetical protein